MHIDITQGRPSAQVRNDATACEELGFAGFWVGETHRDPTTVAGEVADGLIIHPFTTPRYLRDVTCASLAVGADRAGRAHEDVVVCGPVFVCVGRDDEELEQATLASRRQLAFYGSTPSYRPVLELHGWEDLQPALTELSKRGAWDVMAGLIDDEVLETFAVIGRPSEIAGALDARWGELASRVSLYMPYKVQPETLAALADAGR